ncbi:MAG TPA: ATP-dependent DNA ligase [Vicinamibacteria bacterium]|nr:ATP-dependent DNA ligase [Vicinamibacteria bacterium]
MEWTRLVEQVHRVRATSRKSEKVALIAELLKEAHARETELVALYLTGSLPQGRIGLGWRTIQPALPTGPAVGEPLTLLALDEGLGTIAGLTGPGSAERRLRVLRAQFERTDEEGRRLLTELLVGEVRQGALEGLVVEAIAKAASLPLSDVRRAAMYAGGVGELARAALEEGAAGLGRFSLRLLSPVAPMLASPAGDALEVLGRLGEAAFEYKVDGARLQVHRAGDEVRVFTRHLQDVTPRVPEIVEWARTLPVREAVVEGEALALRPDGRPRPFQETMRRLGRSKDVHSVRTELPLSPFFFDLMFLEGEGPLVSLPYAERVARLQRLVSPDLLLPRLATRDPEEAERFFEQAVAAGHEGLMAKSLSAGYEAGQRGFHWLKLKPAHTLDLVILAVERGSGRRSQWLSNLHLGARDAESGHFVMLGKTFKGLTDEMLQWQTEKLTALQVSTDGWAVYVRPELVAEIAFSDVQESPRYPAGLALRFARVKRYRPEKPASEADTLQTVRAIFEKQRA